MTILFLDGHNLMHRARSGFQLGEYNVVYNFFRSLKPLVDQFKPTRVYFTLEGHPKKRHEMLPTYKANRVVDQTTEEGKEKYKTLEDFHRQAGVIVDTMAQFFPISVMRHPDYEADDLVYNVIKNATSAVEFVVVSSDSDFTQLLQEFPNVKLYNPIAKAFVQAPEYDYVTWKALRGDGSDNIPGIPGVGDKTAEQVLDDEDTLRKLLTEHKEVFERNVELIRFARFTEEELKAVQSSKPAKDWDAVAKRFDEWAFKSMLKEPYWTKFKTTFDTLWP